MKRICLLYLCCIIFLPVQVVGISTVYNFRIAQITKQPIFPESHRHHSIIALPFYLRYKKYSGPIQNYGGGLASYIFDHANCYARIDGAASSITAKTDHIVTFSGAATDDILLTAGYNIKFEKQRTAATFSALFGIPTHRIHVLQHPDFGYAQVGLGIQADGLYDFNHISSFMCGTRYVYFIPRTAYDTDLEKHTFTIGNIADILVALRNNWKHHGFELGYTTRFDFGAHCYPILDDTVKKTNYIRNSFYAAYKYRFIINDIANRLVLNIGYGFDHKPKYYGNKYVLNLWASWRVNY